MKNRYVRISKLLSYILRHGPGDYGLALDQYGYAPVKDIIEIIRSRYRNFNREDLQAIVEADAKGRYELAGDKIRACYGHSVAVAARAEAVEPPDFLYHGTSGKSLPLILRDGLLPMTRRYVHLSVTPEEAAKVGRRHSSNVILLRIHARDAHRFGLSFLSEASVFLTGHIPPEFIEVVENEI
jgi:putative RNA 2'-phosphotransferase